MKRTPTFLPGTGVCDALFAGEKGKRTQMKQYREGPIEWITGYMSNDYPFLMFKKKLAERLTRKYPATVTDLGQVMGNGVRSNFYGMQHVNGFPMRPATFPIADNRLLREKEGLSNAWVKPWHREVLSGIVELSCRGLEPSAIKYRVGSSSMAPFLTTDMEKKKEIGRFALESFDRVVSLFNKKDYVTAWLHYQVGGSHIVVYRRQSTDVISYDKGVWASKERKVADLEFATTGGLKGSYSAASKLFGPEVSFKIPDGFFRERNRTAFGGPLAINTYLMGLAQPIRANMYSKYGYTWHHTTRAATQAVMRSWLFAISADVSSHDSLWPTFTIEAIVDGMHKAGVEKSWTTVYELAHRLPAYVTDVDENKGNILIGDWRKPDLEPGLQSGLATTDLDGSWVMTAIYFILQVEHTYPELIPQLQERSSLLRLLDLYLRGKLPITLNDKSDDGDLGWTEHRLVPRALKLQSLMKEGKSVSPYMKIGYEHGGAFLGNIKLFPLSGDQQQIVLIGNINSCVNNEFSPEYGVQSGIADRSRVARPFPGLAWETMASVYGSSPIYGEVRDDVEACWYDVYGDSYGAMRRRLLEQDKLALLKYVRETGRRVDYASLTAIDLEVIATPAKLQYKYVPSDVSPGVLEMLFQGLTLEEVEPFFRKVYRG